MAEPKYLGNQLWVDKSSVAKTSAPTGSSYVVMGRVTRLRLNPQTEIKEIIAPDPGQMARLDVLPVRQTLNFSASVIEVSPLFWNLVFGAALLLDKTGSSQYNPGAGLGIYKGWVKLQQYDHANTLYNTVDLYASLQVTGEVDIGADEITADIEGLVIKSTYNSGVFANLV